METSANYLRLYVVGEIFDIPRGLLGALPNDEIEVSVDRVPWIQPISISLHETS